jgi:hypothetical protein
MIGTRVRRKRDGAKFAVTAQTENAWVLTPDDFGPAIEVTPEALRVEYGVKRVAVPSRADESEGWKRFSNVFRENSRLRPPRRLNPEQTFGILSGDEATVARIANDEALLAQYETALLDVPPAVARRLDALIAERNREARDGRP